MMQQYDHRFASVTVNEENLFRQAQGEGTSSEQHIDPNYVVMPRYWLPEKELINLVGDKKYYLAFRALTDASTNARTGIFCLLPRVATGHTLNMIYLSSDYSVNQTCCLLASLNSLVLDYVIKQKLSGMHFGIFILKQLPVLPPSAYTTADIDFIAPRVLELVYTANDLRPFAEDMGYHGEPFRWEVERRAQLRAELDAYYARLYGLTRDELRYILDPKEVHGDDFPGETFRVLKEKEVKQFGEYRTRRLVLEAWDRL